MMMSHLYNSPSIRSLMSSTSNLRNKSSSNASRISCFERGVRWHSEHPDPWKVRFFTAVSQSSCSESAEQNHQTRLWEPQITWSGVRSLFFSRCHCLAISGNKVWREFVTETLTAKSTRWSMKNLNFTENPQTIWNAQMYTNRVWTSEKPDPWKQSNLFRNWNQEFVTENMIIKSGKWSITLHPDEEISLLILFLHRLFMTFVPTPAPPPPAPDHLLPKNWQLRNFEPWNSQQEIRRASNETSSLPNFSLWCRRTHSICWELNLQAF